METGIGRAVARGLGKGKIAGGAALAQMLAAEGVDTVFGIIDGTYFGFYSAFKDNGIRLITPRHETSAVHMAGAYARATGRLGVCMASNGPGVANALPGVAVEEAEGNRVLLITSSRRDPIIRPDRGGTFQCFPQTEVIGAMSKLSLGVPSVERLAELARAAFRASFTGRPGVVHLDVPENIMNTATDLDPGWLRAPSTYRPIEPLEPNDAQVREAVRLLAEAKRPIIHAGSGILHAGAFEELRQLAERLHAPITTSWAARAVVDERHELAMPMIYIDALKKTRNEADLVLVLGSRLGETDFWGKAPYWAKAEDQKLIQVDIDPNVLGRIRPADLSVQADVRAFLKSALAMLRSQDPKTSAERREWVGKLRAAKMQRRAQLDEKHLSDTCLPMHSARVPAACREVFADDAIMVVDGGNTAIWANFFTELRATNSVLTTPKMGMLGAGVSQALAAQAAFPNRQVYCITGDGAMGFHPQEIETAVRNDLRVIYLVVCDRQWGMVKINQSFALSPIKTLLWKSLPAHETINTDLGEIEWDQLARSMGAHGERVADPAGLEPAILRALASGKPAVIHVDVDPVKHMWAPELKTFKDMHAEPKG